MTLRIASIVTLLILASCANEPFKMLPRPPDGFDAIRFKEDLQLRRDFAVVYEFPKGVVFVNDRTTADGAFSLYCGNLLSNGDTKLECVGMQDGAIILNPESISQTRHSISPDIIEHLRH